ncbi:MAG TPA: hypothetical protein VJ765_13205 [Chitinophagaceae bacterium]|nr:hypothetical protein [Chitinophagaceae bacterium]
MKKYLIVIALAIARLACTNEEPGNDKIAIELGKGNMNDGEKEIRQVPAQPHNTLIGGTNGRLENDLGGVPGSIMGRHLPNNFLNPIE